MKKIYSIIAALVLTVNVFAQAPHLFSYQAIIRDAGNTLLSNQLVSFKITIIQNSLGVYGSSPYSETQSTTTDVNGLATIKIGSGTPVSGTFSSINFGQYGPYWVKIEIDPAGGTNYTIASTSQLLSVPFAMYANTSGNEVLTPGPQGPQGPTGKTGAVGLTGPQGPTGSGVPQSGLEGQVLTIVNGVATWVTP